MIGQRVIIFFRRPMLSVGLIMLAVGGAGLAGGQAEALAGYRLAEGSAAGLIALTGLVLVSWDVIRWFRAGAGPREQRWEVVVDEGIVQAINGNWDEAFAQFQRAMDMAGPDPRKLRAAERIGGYLEGRRRASDAIPYLHTALAIRYRMFGTTDPATRALRLRLSNMHRSAGDPDGASQLLAAELDAVSPGGRVITVEGASVASQLADALFEAGDAAGARELSQNAIAALEQTDPYSPVLVKALVVSARFSVATGDLAAAEASLDRATACCERSGSDDQLDGVRRGLIDLYARTGRYAEAVPLSAKLLRAGTSSTKRPDMEETVRTNRRHADLLEHAGRPDEAARFRKTADTLERLYSPASAPRPPQVDPS